VISGFAIWCTLFVLFNVFMLHQIFRNYWVYRRRVEWIYHDLYDFNAKAPSYEYMLWHFWIWDMKQFGFNKGDSSEQR
jgi:hypothetical protein